MSNPDVRRPRTLALDVARRLDPLCDRFEDELLAGRQPRLEDFLDGVPAADRPALLRELLGLELDYRTGQGERPQAEEYRQRLPGLADAIEAVFGVHTPTGSEASSSSPPTRPAPPAATVTNESGTGRAGRYQIEEEIARGGMGAVLRVRDPDLNRTLAVKVLHADLRNRPEAERRFREEAQITGQLQHPGIPPVHEVGALPDGRPFFAMKLVKGRTLAALLKERPEPAHDRPRFLKVFEQVCQTVAYAHSRGIVHRDLKPANVMVGAFGEVQVMDWGLAKVLGQPGSERPAAPADALSTIRTLRSGSPGSETQPGSVMGTPAYMPPEQALGLVDRLDRRCDVFGLGAILCEVLTGQPAYVAPDGDAAWRKAVRADLADAFALLDGCGADSELVALAKGCLAAEPDDRLADAGVVARAVAEYLAEVEERLQRTELERAAVEMKVGEERKRRRLVVGLAAALIVGTAVSTYFAFQADRRATDADASAEIAKGKEQEALTKEKEANLARAKTEEAMARGLLRPLGHGPGSLNDIELDALWELAESPSDRVRLLFVANALETEGNARQLRNRGELALHAAVGLDRQRRQRIEGMLLSSSRDDSASLVLRENLARGVVTANPGPELAAAAACLLSEALAKETNASVRLSLARDLAAVAAKLRPAEAAAAARLLYEALAKEKFPDARSALADGLGVVAARLGPEEAARYAAAAARLLSEALAKETNASVRLSLARDLAAVAARLGPEEAARYAAAAARLLSEALVKEKDPTARSSLAQGLAAVAARLGPTEAASAARLLSEALAKETNPSARTSLARGLAAVATRLGPAEAAAAALQLSEALAKETTSYVRTSLAQGLAAVAARLGPAEAARLLSEALVKEKDPYAKTFFAYSLAAVAVRLGPTEAASAARLLSEALAKETNSYARSSLVQGLAAVAARLGPTEAASAARLLSEALAKEIDFYTRSSLVQGLAAVAARLGPTEAASAARLLSEALAKEIDSDAGSDVALGLAVVTARLDPEEAARYAAAAARLLSEALAKDIDDGPRSNLAVSLAAVAARLGPEEAARYAAAAAHQLSEALAEATNASARLMLARGLGVVAARLGPEEAARYAAAAARLLSEALAKETNSYARSSLAQRLAAVAARLGPTEAASAARLLTEALAQEKDADARSSLVQGLAAVATRLGPAEAASAARLLTEAVAKETNSYGQSALADGLGAVMVRLGPEEATRRSLLATRAVAETPFPHPLAGLAALVLAAQPLPSRFSTQELVELLKMPTCVGPARAVILQQLGGRYNRDFADQWEFVDYAEKHLPDIDLKSPPKRPGK